MVHYLSDRHQQLSSLSQGLMLRWIHRLDATGRNTVVGGLIAIGAIGAAAALSGTMSPMQYFCVSLPDGLQCTDDGGKPLSMTGWHWERWTRDGKPAEMVPHPTVGLVPASNPYKPAWALMSLLSFSAAASALRVLQAEAGELAVLDDISAKRQAGLADMAARADMIEAMTPVAVAQAHMEAEVDRVLTASEAQLRVAQVTSEAEVQIAQLEADHAVMDYHLIGVPEDEKEGVIRALQYARQLKTPFLPQLDGDTLDSIANPSDKVDGKAQGQLQPPDPETLKPQSLPEEDIAITIANASPDAHMNVAIAGESGSGKTSVVLNALKAKHDKEQGMIDLQVFNGKPEVNVDWGGLRSSPSDYMAVNTPDRALEMVYKFRSLHGVLTQWQDGKNPKHAPMLAMFDEVNNQRLCIPKVKISTDKNGLLSEIKGTQQAKDVFDETMKLYVTQCRSERSGCWIMTHSYLVENIGLDRQLQKSFSFVVLGRGNHELIAGALRDADLISSQATRDRLRELYERAVPQLPAKTAIALTNVDGPWRLIRLPRYNKKVYIARGPLNQSAHEIDGDDLAKRIDAMADKTDTPRLTDRQQAILEHCEANEGWHTPSQLQAKVWACRGVKAADIIQDFAVLTATRHGKPEKAGRTTRWRYSPEAQKPQDS